MDFGDPDRALDNIEGLIETSGATLPEGLAGEMALLPGARNLRVSGNGAVIGYMVDMGVTDACERLTECMRALGWTAIPGGREYATTYMKTNGRCTWALATCEEMGSATGVVVRCVIA